MEANVAESMPTRQALEELERFRQTARELCTSYLGKLEQEIDVVRDTLASAKKLESNSKMRDLREILTLLRNFEIKPGKGKRKDFKKVENALTDLTMLTESW